MQLQGYNNLTKSLAITLYKIAYVDSVAARARYNRHIAKRHSAEQLSVKLTNYASLIGGQVLNSAIKDYQPQGASVTLMIAEELIEETVSIPTASVVSHMDKSHICVHTYPEEEFINNKAIFRADIEISTCGLISPLKIINELIDDFAPDLINFDYRIRGFNRLKGNNKQYLDHEITSIQQYISAKNLVLYHKKELNLEEINLFHTSLLCKTLSNKAVLNFCDKEILKMDNVEIEKTLIHELEEIYHNR